MRKDIKIVFIHGNETEDWGYFWAPWVKEQLDALGLHTEFHTMPDGILARKEFWLPFMEEVLKIDEHTLILGHSSGATAALYYAQRHKIFGSVLLAPCYTDMGIEEERLSGWYDDEWDWKKIKENQEQIGLLYSLDDDVIPKEEFFFIKDHIAPDLVFEFNDKGHFISEDAFPEVIDCIRKILSC
ncbi:MAG: retinoblastoma-binding protein 9 [Nanoarchaeota archaeon]|nr:retinoblastoma-binding protein 9 [Nanoarchaeota archaeon]